MKSNQPALLNEKMNDFEKICREQGVPLTVQRRTILESLTQRDDHPTADQVFEEVARHLPSLSRTTVYRVLETLVKLGVIHKAAHLGSAARYDANTHLHHHLTCLSCHKVVDVEDESIHGIELTKTQSKGFEIQGYSVHFRGYCLECSAKLKPSRTKKGRD